MRTAILRALGEVIRLHTILRVGFGVALVGFLIVCYRIGIGLRIEKGLLEPSLVPLAAGATVLYLLGIERRTSYVRLVRPTRWREIWHHFFRAADILLFHVYSHPWRALVPLTGLAVVSSFYASEHIRSVSGSGALLTLVAVQLGGLASGLLFRSVIVARVFREQLMANVVADRVILFGAAGALPGAFITLSALGYGGEFLQAAVVGVVADAIVWFKRRRFMALLRRALICETYARCTALAHTHPFAARFRDLLRRGRVGEARRLVRRLGPQVTGEEERITSCVCAGTLMLLDKQRGRLSAFLRQALADYPDCPCLLNLLAGLHFSLAQHQEGVVVLRRALEMSPDNAHIHANLGAMLGEMGRPKEAVEELRAAVRLDQTCGSAKAHLALYMAEYVDEFCSEGIGSRERILLDALMLVLQAERALVDGSIGAVGRMDPVPTNVFLKDIEALIFFRMGNRRLSHEMWVACLQMDPHYARAHVHLAQLFGSLGDESREHFELYRTLFLTRRGDRSYSRYAREILASAGLEVAQGIGD